MGLCLDKMLNKNIRGPEKDNYNIIMHLISMPGTLVIARREVEKWDPLCTPKYIIISDLIIIATV